MNAATTRSPGPTAVTPGPDLLHDPGDLVAEHARRRERDLALHHVQVGVADPAAVHAHEHLAGERARPRNSTRRAAARRAAPAPPPASSRSSAREIAEAARRWYSSHAPSPQTPITMTGRQCRTAPGDADQRGDDAARPNWPTPRAPTRCPRSRPSRPSPPPSRSATRSRCRRSRAPGRRPAPPGPPPVDDRHERADRRERDDVRARSRTAPRAEPATSRPPTWATTTNAAASSAKIRL